MGVKAEELMRSLELGHGYEWTVLTRQPLLIAYGHPTLGNMPELLITGSRSIVIDGGDPVYVNRIRQVLNMLQRRGNLPVVNQEGVQHE